MELVTFLHITIESGFAMFCVLAAIYLHLYDHGKRKSVRIMTAGLLINAAVNIMDALAYFYRGEPSQTGFYMVRISNFAVFAGMFVLLAFGNKLLGELLDEAGYADDRRMRIAVYALSAAGVAVIVILRRFGLIYTFDGQNLYHRAPGYWLIPLIAITAIVILLVRTVRARGSISRNEFIVLMMFFLLPVAGVSAQTFYYGISLANIANSVSILVMAVIFARKIVSEISIKRSFILNGESIESISEDVSRFLEETGTERQNRIRIRFTIEEALISIWQHFGDLNMVKVIAGINFGIPSIRIEHVGASFNPFTKTDPAHEAWSSSLLASAGLSPAYSYSHGTNVIRIRLNRMQINPVVTVIIAIVFGLLAGSVAIVALSGNDAVFLTDEILVPVYDLWNNILFSVAAPAMLIIVMSTMLDTREVDEQGGNAGFITGRYFVFSLVIGAITIVAAVLASGHRVVFNEFTRYEFADLMQKLFEIVPQNILDPFITFNTAQLILMGIVFAYALMAVGQQAGGLVSLIHQLNMISTQLVQWIATLMPLFTVFLTAQLILSNNAQLLLSIVHVIPFSVLFSILIMAVTLVFIGKRLDVSPSLLMKKLWPSFILTLRTGQVSDSYALAENTCIRDFGIQKIFTQRMMPLGLVLYMPASMVGMVSFVVYGAIRSGIEVTPVWILIAIVLVLILLVAAPPIPGINILSYVVIIGQLGIGKEYILAAMIFDIIYNVFASAANQMLLQLDMLLQAERVGLLNHKKLEE